MSEINIGQLSEAINDKADRNLQNVDTTAKADAVIDYQEPTADNDYTWYRKYASGWVEQGGHAAPLYAGQAVSFPVIMNDTNYTYSVQGRRDGTMTGFIVFSVANPTTTGMTICGNWSHESPADTVWRVEGMAA